MLSALDSPIYTGREKFTVPDLLVAVKCCKGEYGKTNKMGPTLQDVWWSWRYRRDQKLFKKHAELMFKWMGVQSSRPKYWKPSSDGKTEKKVLDRAPRCLGLVCSLMNRGNMTRHEAWNTPLGEAQWMDAQIAKLEGVELNFLDDADLAD